MVVRACLRSRWEAAVLDEVRTAAAQPDFDGAAVAAAAQAEGVAPLVYSVIRDQGWLSAEAEQPLRMAYYQNARRNVLLFRELGVVLQHLTAAGIPVIVLKGAALAHIVYANPAVRPMCDVDLLVREADVPAALRVLRDVGFTLIPPRAYRNEVMARRTSAFDFVIELHWHLFVIPYYIYTLSNAWLWETVLPLQIEGNAVHSLGPEAQLLHLCGHLYLHHALEGSQVQLIWLHDIAEVLRQYQAVLDWPAFLDAAQCYGLVQPVQKVFALLRGLHLPIPVPVFALVDLLSPTCAEQRVFEAHTASRRNRWLRLWADWEQIPGWQQRLHFLWHNLFPPVPYMHALYQISPRRLPGCYLMRLLGRELCTHPLDTNYDLEL